MNMNPGNGLEKFHIKEVITDPREKAREYLEDPDRESRFKEIFEKYGNRSNSARGDIVVINKLVGFPMAYLRPGKPDIINYMKTNQIQDFIDSVGQQKEAA